MKKHISFNSVFLIVYFSIFIISIIFTVLFGRLLYLLTSLILFIIILYFINISKKREVTLKKKIIPSIAVLILIPFFSYISGLVSYRPTYSFYFYKKTLLKDSSIFNYNMPDDSKIIRFDILMENQRGQKVSVSYSTDDIFKVKEYYKDLVIAQSEVAHALRYENQTYYFTFKSSLKGNPDNYIVYYTELSDEHQTGIAINSKEKIIMLFET